MQNYLNKMLLQTFVQHIVNTQTRQLRTSEMEISESYVNYSQTLNNFVYLAQIIITSKFQSMGTRRTIFRRVFMLHRFDEYDYISSVFELQCFEWS